MATSSEAVYRKFLSSHYVDAKECKTPSHTRIGDRQSTPPLPGGRFLISEEELPQFWSLYYKHVLEHGGDERLTEAQQKEAGPVLIDLDFRFAGTVPRQHTPANVLDLVQLYLDTLDTMVCVPDNTPYSIFVLEKPSPNTTTVSNCTKDGIHVIVGLHVDRVTQVLLRKSIVQSIEQCFDDLSVTNSWDAVVDEGLAEGHTNWTVYGSHKPHHEAYRLTYHFTAVHRDGQRELNEIDLDEDEDAVPSFSVFTQLSAQYRHHPPVTLHPAFQPLHAAEVAARNKASKNTKSKSSSSSPSSKSSSPANTTAAPSPATTEDALTLALALNYDEIRSPEALQEAIAFFLSTLTLNELYIKDLYEYLQILPEAYYASGQSHLKSRMVAFALKHTEVHTERTQHVPRCLFLLWLSLRARDAAFDFEDIPTLLDEWNHLKLRDIGGVTKRSIMYWAKQDAPEQFEQIKLRSVQALIDQTLHEGGDCDFANVLYLLFRDKYICTDWKKNEWHVFRNHRWEKDKGVSIRKCISTELHSLYSAKQAECLRSLSQCEPGDETHTRITKKLKRITEVCMALKSTSKKNNILREAAELFFDHEFNERKDDNPYLLGCTNGVIDFQTNEFRPGQPLDYITKSTKIPYYSFDSYQDSCPDIVADIDRFMHALFPDEALYEYVVQHLAAILIGNKREQAFYIYFGSGSNGKSMLEMIKAESLGDYKVVIPMSFFTDRRRGMGQATPELAKFQGARDGTAQEGTKGAKINEGPMKELTSNTERIQARALFEDAIEFRPQMTVNICLNNLPEFETNDDGTWRRIRKIDFVSKFVDTEEDILKFKRRGVKHVFLKDVTLPDKLKTWAPVFLSWLVSVAFKTKGFIQPCEQVMRASEQYRAEQDAIGGFIHERLMVADTSPYGDGATGTKRQSIWFVFTSWFEEQFGKDRKKPTSTELQKELDVRFGERNPVTNEWANVFIKP